MELNFPNEPNFKCIEDNTSIIGFKHTAYYTATIVDQDGFRSMSRNASSWEGIKKVTQDLFEIHHADSVELASVVYIGKGYINPDITRTVIGTVTL